jgi:hypothetical protein
MISSLLHLYQVLDMENSLESQNTPTASTEKDWDVCFVNSSGDISLGDTRTYGQKNSVLGPIPKQVYNDTHNTGQDSLYAALIDPDRKLSCNETIPTCDTPSVSPYLTLMLVTPSFIKSYVPLR